MTTRRSPGTANGTGATEGFEKLILTPPIRSAGRREFSRRGLLREMAQVEASLRDVFKRLVKGESRWPLFLHGGVGTGKTRAALALCDVVQESEQPTFSADTGVRYDHSPAYFTFEEICTAVMQDDVPKWRAVEHAILLAIDELGARANVGDLQRTTLQRILDEREERRNRVAVYISNLTPNQLAQLYDDRIMSRLTCGTVFKLVGADRRQVDDAEVLPLRKETA